MQKVLQIKNIVEISYDSVCTIKSSFLELGNECFIDIYEYFKS